jgi:ribonucleoside-diphosphate reductase alpha chain
VQHLEFLSQDEKDVFKTFSEIAPMSIVQQAAARQKYIDQAQSLNLLIAPDASIKDVNALIIEGWRLGIKTFYYQRSANPAQQLVRDILSCAVCEA